jgi:hypothetical protein
MTALSAVPGLRAPDRIVVLSPDAFADTWLHKPRADVAVGLRRISVAQVNAAMIEATREAAGVYDAHPDGSTPILDDIIDARNEYLLCNALAVATTDPNDITRPYFEFADATIRQALTTEGLRRLWDELTILTRGNGLALPVASDEDAKLLGRALLSGIAAPALDDEGRKLIAYLLEKVERGLPPETLAGPMLLEQDEPDEPAEEDEEVKPFIARVE